MPLSASRSPPASLTASLRFRILLLLLLLLVLLLALLSPLCRGFRVMYLKQGGPL